MATKLLLISAAFSFGLSEIVRIPRPSGKHLDGQRFLSSFVGSLCLALLGTRLTELLTAPPRESTPASQSPGKPRQSSLSRLGRALPLRMAGRSCMSPSTPVCLSVYLPLHLVSSVANLGSLSTIAPSKKPSNTSRCHSRHGTEDKGRGLKPKVGKRGGVVPKEETGRKEAEGLAFTEPLCVRVTHTVSRSLHDSSRRERSFALILETWKIGLSEFNYRIHGYPPVSGTAGL